MHTLAHTYTRTHTFLHVHSAFNYLPFTCCVLVGQSTDSDSSSPDGSPAITRKKRIWERTGKAKETYTALRGTGKSAEDITTRKEKKVSTSSSCSDS